MHEKRIVLNPSNVDKFDFSSVKGEIVIAVSAEIKSNLQQNIDEKEALELINSMGVKKAYQVIKTKYKISRNDFYKFAMELKNE